MNYEGMKIVPVSMYSIHYEIWCYVQYVSMFWKFGTLKKIQSHESADARALKKM